MHCVLMRVAPSSCISKVACIFHEVEHLIFMRLEPHLQCFHKSLPQVTSADAMLAVPPVAQHPSGGAGGGGDPPEEDNDDKRKKLKASELIQGVVDEAISDDDELQWEHNKKKGKAAGKALPFQGKAGKAGTPFPPAFAASMIADFAQRTPMADRLLRDKGYNERRFMCIACTLQLSHECTLINCSCASIHVNMH